jgi:hypothetical protein
MNCHSNKSPFIIDQMKSFTTTENGDVVWSKVMAPILFRASMQERVEGTFIPAHVFLTLYHSNKSSRNVR